MTETREEHLARMPKDDSYVEIFFLDNAGDGAGMVMEGGGDVTIDMQPWGLCIDSKISNQRRVYPWPSIWKYAIHWSTDDYLAAMRQWYKDCDHVWLTHPNEMTYCEFCRIDMNELGRLMSDDIEGVPTVVKPSDKLDEQSRAFDKIGDGQRVHFGCQHRNPADASIVCTYPVGHGPIDVSTEESLGDEPLYEGHGNREAGVFWTETGGVAPPPLDDGGTGIPPIGF